MISGEIRRFLRDDGMIKVSRSLKKLSYKCGKKKEELTERMGREPTMEELATSLGTEKEELGPGNGGGNGGRVDLQADPSGGRFATEHSGQAGRKKQTGRTSSEPDDAVSDFRRTGQGGTTVDLSEVFSGKDTGSSGGDSGDFTGSGVENGKENTGADEKADVSRL